MKYILLTFFLLGLSACSSSNRLSESSSGNTVPPINVAWVQVSDSGVSVSSDSGDVSVGEDGKVLIDDDSGNISAGEDGASVTSGHNTMKAWKDGVSVGTGIKIPVQKTDGMEKDPEIQSITNDIDKIFSDIEKGGK